RLRGGSGRGHPLSPLRPARRPPGHRGPRAEPGRGGGLDRAGGCLMKLRPITSVSQMLLLPLLCAGCADRPRSTGIIEGGILADHFDYLLCLADPKSPHMATAVLRRKRAGEEPPILEVHQKLIIPLEGGAVVRLMSVE